MHLKTTSRDLPEFPEPPPQWATMEAELREASSIPDHTVLLPDDKDHDRVWAAQGYDLMRYLYQTIEQDENWSATRPR